MNHVGQIWPESGQICPGFDQLRRTFSQNRPRIARLRPMLARCRLNWDHAWRRNNKYLGMPIEKRGVFVLHVYWYCVRAGLVASFLYWYSVGAGIGRTELVQKSWLASQTGCRRRQDQRARTCANCPIFKRCAVSPRSLPSLSRQECSVVDDVGLG